MSAQAGIWNFDGKPADKQFLVRLIEAIAEYSPDGENIYIDGSVGMLYRPLHTTPESQLECQPHISPRGFVITWDGRLDNRDEIIGQFSGQLTGNSTDLVIVTAAFERWDSDCFHRLVGDWAISIWMPERRELVLAADYMAIRHIFYYQESNRILWSTDLAPLVLLSGGKFQIDDDYIAGYFANDPSSHLTPYREISEVPAGKFVRIRRTGALVQRYCDFSAKRQIRYKTDAEYEDHFLYLFRQSVRRRLRSNSPILAELSGGLDSSSIVCMADDILAKEGALTPRLDTLFLCDESEPNGDDLSYLRKVEEKRGRVGAHIDNSKVSDSGSFDYPKFSPIPGYLGFRREVDARCAAVVREGGYGSVLSGIGGDEFLGGVPNPTPYLADLIVQFKPATLANQLMAWSLVKRRPWIQLMWDALVDLMPAGLAQHWAKQAKVETWLKSDFAKRTGIAIRQLDVDEHFGLWLPTRRSYVGGVVAMANKMSKRNLQSLPSAEARYPYLDQSLIEFIVAIPPTQLLRPGERRSLMRRALRELVPQEILARRTKQVATRLPVMIVEANWQNLEVAFDSSFSSQLGFLDPDIFLDRLRSATIGKEIHIVRMLKTISLEFWLRDLSLRGLMEVDLAARPTKPETVRANV